MIKLKYFWCMRYVASSKTSNYAKRIVVIYRRITWINPDPEFRDAMMLRFKHKKQVSYNPKTDRLYLYSKFRVWETVTRLNPENPIGGFYGSIDPGH